MLDFETFGNGKNALVCQIGACFFNRNTGEIGETFKRNVCAISAAKSGGEFDASTVYWWLSQSPAAIVNITSKPRTDIVNAFIELNKFLGPAKAIWSHATFDFVILQATLKRLNIPQSFRYNVARDIRTLMDLANNVHAKNMIRAGIHHDALDDCKFQVAYVVAALNSIKKAS